MTVKIVRSALVVLALAAVCLVVVFATASSAATVADQPDATVDDSGMVIYYCCCPTIPYCKLHPTPAKCSPECTGPYLDCDRCDIYRDSDE